MESCSDRRFMYFEWYHLQAAALGLKWKQGDWNWLVPISVLPHNFFFLKKEEDMRQNLKVKTNNSN